MEKQVRQSLIINTGMAMAMVLLLAVMNMLVSFLIAESVENDAVRINLAGSLRMQSYRITNQLLTQHNNSIAQSSSALEQQVNDFEQRLYRPVLAKHIHASSVVEVAQAFNLVEVKWQSLKPRLLSQGRNDRQQLLAELEALVVVVNEMVKKLELQTEGKFRLLRMMQGIFLLLTMVVAVVAMVNINKKVVVPLRELMSMASKIRAADFSMRVNDQGSDELSLLASTFNEMSASLETMYHSLEHRVREKTLYLQEAQAGLQLLYDSSRALISGDNFIEQLERTVRELQRYLAVQRVDLYMMNSRQDHPFLVSSGQNSHVLVNGVEALLQSNPDSEQSYQYPLKSVDKDYGYLVVICDCDRCLTAEQCRIVEALVDTLVAAIGAEAQHDNARRLALIEERTAIARELHDSLAQSLSYAKIQLSRFQMLQQKGTDQSELDQVLEDIKTGMQTAYRQLRELLATFRLQLTGPGLSESLALTVSEFSEKGGLAINLQNELINYPLSANEDIHVLQIIREALSNVLRHAEASSAEVCLHLNDRGLVEALITDDGKGFDKQAQGPNHYGKAIMLERAAVLGGKIVFADNPQGGASVILSFRPEVLSVEKSSQVRDQ